MVGDSRLFQESLKRGAAHAWAGRWDMAVEEYRRALEESPKDHSAQMQLAMALFKSGQLEESLRLYRELWNAHPSNLSLLQKLGEVEEALGDRESAATTFQLLAEIHGRRHAHKEALRAWQRMVELLPDDLAMWDSLMQTAVHAGMVAEVMPGYLNLARDLALCGRFEDAIQVVESAQTLDPDNPTVPELLGAIRRGLEHSWRAAAAGEDVSLEDLARLIPPIQVIERPRARPDVTGEPAPSLVGLARIIASQRLQPPPVPTMPTTSDSVAEPLPSVEEPQREPEIKTAPDDRTHYLQKSWWEEKLPGPEASAGDQLTVMQPVSEEDGRDVEQITVTAASLAEVQPEAAELPSSGGEDALLVARGVDAAGISPPSDETIGALPEQTVEEGRCESLEAADVSSEHLPPDESESPESGVEASLDQPPVEEQEQQPPWGEAVGSEDDVADEESALAGTVIAEQLVELAEAHERLGQDDDAASAYERALEISPDLPRALLGMARLHLSAHQLELAQEKTRRVLETAKTDEVNWSAIETMLEILRERAVSGDLGTVAGDLFWLRAKVGESTLPEPLGGRLAAAPVELLGWPAGEHLEEVVHLAPDSRGEVVLALRRAEEMLESGQIRSSADEMYGVVAGFSDFLPAQLMLAKALLAQGRVEDARDRLNRLAELYEIRGAPQQARTVRDWLARASDSGGEAGVQLVELPLAPSELEGVDLASSTGPPQAPSPEAAGGVEQEVQELLQRQERALAEAPAVSRGVKSPFWDVVLSRAESSLAAGDRDAAAKLVRVVLDVDGAVDRAMRAALLRTLQRVEPTDGQRHELADLLRELGLPEDLAD